MVPGHVQHIGLLAWALGRCQGSLLMLFGEHSTGAGVQQLGGVHQPREAGQGDIQPGYSGATVANRQGSHRAHLPRGSPGQL